MRREARGHRDLLGIQARNDKGLNWSRSSGENGGKGKAGCSWWLIGCWFLMVVCTRVVLVGCEKGKIMDNFKGEAQDTC